MRIENTLDILLIFLFTAPILTCMLILNLQILSYFLFLALIFLGVLLRKSTLLTISPLAFVYNRPDIPSFFYYLLPLLIIPIVLTLQSSLAYVQTSKLRIDVRILLIVVIAFLPTIAIHLLCNQRYLLGSADFITAQGILVINAVTTFVLLAVLSWMTKIG